MFFSYLLLISTIFVSALKPDSEVIYSRIAEATFIESAVNGVATLYENGGKNKYCVDVPYDYNIIIEDPRLKEIVSIGSNTNFCEFAFNLTTFDFELSNSVGNIDCAGWAVSALQKLNIVKVCFEYVLNQFSENTSDDFAVDIYYVGKKRSVPFSVSNSNWTVFEGKGNRLYVTSPNSTTFLTKLK